jgi:hypothetical protein
MSRLFLSEILRTETAGQGGGGSWTASQLAGAVAALGPPAVPAWGLRRMAGAPSVRCPWEELTEIYRRVYMFARRTHRLACPRAHIERPQFRIEARCPWHLMPPLRQGCCGGMDAAAIGCALLSSSTRCAGRCVLFGGSFD